ncbi:D-isomer specific 2-hydroxyacid dehydrogenase family protein [Actinoplanes sp. NPDC049265]|uniref:D-isomer specific 2-hydroxyacid dehydrogenase family protein n=1 Tax=Actinoplanes sp. NPDC049265 TaxID=3363902 RepID=UPI003716B26A
MGITIYGCQPDEAVLFGDMAPGLDVIPTIIEEPVTEANVELALGNRHISVSHKTRITNSTLLALSHAGVEYIVTRSIGFNHIDVKYAASVGITVDNISYSADSVADYTLMLMLMCIRNMKAVIRRSDVHDYRLHETRGRELRDMTVGVVGTGRIGRAVLDRLKGFGCQVLTFDTKPEESDVHVHLDELVQRSDIVSLHVPLTPDTHHLLNRRRIEQMKRGAIVVNTGRGPLIDTEALISALENGGLGGAALDVLEGEEGIFYADRRNKPIENKSLLRLQEMPNVVISPHSAYFTDHALSDTVENSILNCLKFESGNQRG